MSLKQRLPRPPAEGDFTSPLRGEWLTARVGLLLGVCMGIAFLTGLVSHEAQQLHPLVHLPSRPAWGYRVTQGVHIASGTAAIPLLLVKLWSVFPKLFAEIPKARISAEHVRALVLHLTERASIALLVAASLLELFSGLANSAQWYPWSFSFQVTHYALGWIVIGSLILHIAVKLPVIRRALRSRNQEVSLDGYAGLSRRALFNTSVLAAGVAVLGSAGGSVPLLRQVSVFGVRDGSGPQHLPVNRSARAAGVVASALDPGFILALRCGAHHADLTRADLEAMRQYSHDLPIACVEGWSANATWTGVRLRALLDLVEAPVGARVRATSLQQHGAWRVSELPGNFADDPLTLLALRLNGETLALDHGYPCRLIAPNRPGVLQTKWVQMLEVIT